MNKMVNLTPKTRKEVLTAAVTVALIAPATAGYLSLLEGWNPRIAGGIGVLIGVWLVVALQSLFREEFAVGLVTGVALGAACGSAYYGV
jgi:hypothetical protein